MPNFRAYAEGESIPPVDSEDIKRMRPRIRIGTTGWSWVQDSYAALSPGADFSAVESRCGTIRTMTIHKVLIPWQRGEEFDDAVFRVAATIPLRHLKHKSYRIPGDELFGFDPNAFVQRLVEETGIAHSAEPIRTKVTEGCRCFAMGALDSGDPDREAKRQAREVLWMIFKRFSPILNQVTAHDDGETAANNAAILFADFLINNIDLVRQLEASFRVGSDGGQLDLLTELEQRARGGA